MDKDAKIIEIDDIQYGYNHFDKLKNLASDIKKEIIKTKPIRVSDDSILKVFDDSLKGLLISEEFVIELPYSWELYHLDNSHVIMLEYKLRKEGIGRHTAPLKLKRDSFTRLKLTLHPADKDIENKIEKILAKYPKEPRNDMDVLENYIVNEDDKSETYAFLQIMHEDLVNFI